MYAGPTTPKMPTSSWPSPSTSAMTGEPGTPSIQGSRLVARMPMWTGHPGSSGPAGFDATVGSLLPPAGIACTRPLALSSSPRPWNMPIDVLPAEEKFTASRYSSLAPTTTTCLPSPRSAPTAGVDTSLVPWSATAWPFTLFGTTWLLTGSIEAICVRSTTSTVHPGGDDLELAVAVEVGQDRRGQQAALQAVEAVTGAARREARVGANREAG